MSAVQVAVAVIADAHGRILISRRAERSHQGGLWEFPGGKVEPGESVTEALSREIREELGLEVLGSRPLIRLSHRYPEKTVDLDVRRVTAFRGVARGLEGQPLAWVMPQDLRSFEFPEADYPILTALELPPTYLVTGADPRKPEAFLNRLSAALAQGIRLVQLRAKELGSDRYEELAGEAARLCSASDARLILNADPELVSRVGAHGVHLTSGRLSEARRRPLNGGFLVAASCHGVNELRLACKIGADFVVLSPVLPTRSHPQARPLGWRRFAALARRSCVPVYALGGMELRHVETARALGGQGVAGISGLWPS